MEVGPGLSGKHRRNERATDSSAFRLRKPGRWALPKGHYVRGVTILFVLVEYSTQGGGEPHSTVLEYGSSPTGFGMQTSSYHSCPSQPESGSGSAGFAGKLLELDGMGRRPGSGSLFLLSRLGTVQDPLRGDQHRERAFKRLMQPRPGRDE